MGSVPTISQPVRSRVALLIAVVAAAAFVALLGLVARHLTDGWDGVIRQLARPADVWGEWQLRADVVVEGLRPGIVGPALALFAAVHSAARRSLRPAVLVTVGGGAATALTLLVKYLVARPDPHHGELSHGGSFPSGHTMSVTVAAGLVVLLLRPAAKWAWLLPASLGGLMAVSLVVQAAHWASDVVGGALVALAVLAGVQAGGLARWARGGSLRSEDHPGGPDRVGMAGSVP